MYCSNCGKKLNKDGKCSNCEKLKKEKTNNNQNKEVQNNKELSNVLGIVTIVSAFFINILSIPTGIISIISGSKYKKETGEKCYGPVLSIIGICLSVFFLILICVFIFFIIIFASTGSNNSSKSDYNYKDDSFIFSRSTEQYLNGEWLHTESGGSYEFDVDDKEYEMYNTSNHLDNYCIGTFNITEEGSYKNNEENKIYYNIKLNPKRCVIDGNTETYFSNEKEQKFTGILDNTKNNLILVSEDNNSLNLKRIDD